MATKKKNTQEYFQYGEYTVLLEQKRMKNMYLRIMENGVLHVTAPFFMEKQSVLRFLGEKEDWIREHVAKKKENEQTKALQIVSGEEISLFGETLTLEVTEYGARSRAFVEGNLLKLMLPGQSTFTMRKKALDYFYKTQLEAAVKEAFAVWEPVVGKKHSGFTLRDMKTRWGSCNVKTGHITLNTRLVEKPRQCLDYVVVHELCHLWVANHGPEFKACMNQFYPEWKRVKQVLNNQ